MIYHLKVPKKERVVTAERFNKNACVDKQKQNYQNRCRDNADWVNGRAWIFKTLSEVGDDREASDERNRKYEYVGSN